MRTMGSVVPAAVALVGVVAITATAIVIAQDRKSLHPDLSGRWRLNRELSENAEAKLERMQSQSPGSAGPRRHGGGLGGSSGGAQQAQMEEARSLVLDAPPWFVLTQDGERIVLTDSGGRVRTLTASGRKEKVDGRDVRTRWDNQRLISEISLGSAKVTETYERSTDAPQLIITTKMEMHGRELSVRRVYDAEASGD
jgi:hypothetical protein